MDEDIGDDDIYAQQLKEVFNSCDLQNKGYINRNELIDLSQKLQLGDQVPELLREILGDEFSDGKVTFEEFKEGFVNILANAIDCLDDVTDDQSDWSEICDRRSIVNTPDFLGKEKIYGSPLHAYHKTSTPNVIDDKRQEVIKSNQSSGSGHGETESDEAVQLRRVWDDLAVGESGYLNLLQLSIVCEHIGMEGMADDEIELLFSELDKNGDGFVSFEEFLEGLFLNKGSLSARSTKTITPIVVEEPVIEAITDEPVQMESNQTLIEERRELKTPTNDKKEQMQHPPLKKKRSSPRENIRQENQGTDLFLSLDPFNSGRLKSEELVSYFKKNSLQELEYLVKDANKDKDGMVKTRDLVLQFERIIYEKENPITRSVLLTYKKEISRLREDVEKSGNELSTMKNKSNMLDEQNRTFARESEEQLKKSQEENEKKLREQSKNYAEKLTKKEQELKQQRESMLKEHQIENEELRERLKEIKAEDTKTKAKLREASLEISKLEENLSGTMNALNEERNKYTRFQQVLESEKGMKQKIDELEGQLTSLAGLRTKQKDRIRQLEESNKILQYQGEEQESRIAELQLKLATAPKEKELDNGVKRNGSYLSEYLKPNIIRRNQFGDSMDEEETSNKEMEELKSKIFEQEKTIESLRRDLYTVNQILEENDSSSSNRHGLEISRLTDKFAGEIAELQLTMSEEKTQLTENFGKEKSNLIEHYENKIEDMLRNFNNEKQNILSGHQHEKKRWEQGKHGGKSVKRWENLFQIEREEIELKYRGQITKLEEKIVILETEMAEIELRFLNEKAELEQRFRIERAELMQNATTVSREYDSSQKYIDSLKDELTKKQANTLQQMQDQHHKDKQRFKDKMENELNKLKSKHSKEISDERKNFQNQVSELEKNFTAEQASLKESFVRERTEMELKFARELKECRETLRQNYEHEMAVQLSEIRKISLEERTRIEEELRDEKYELTKNLQTEVNTYERKLKNIKNELELSFADERNRIKENFELEFSTLERTHKREISELQQAFSNGEAGIKTKIKEDFQKLLKEQKCDLEESYRIEKEQLVNSFNREKAALQSGWQLEKLSMRENFKKEKEEMEFTFGQEKRALKEKSQKQKQKLEELYRKQKQNNQDNQTREIENTIIKETQHLQTTVQHLENEVALLREQKKELETKNQVFEIKSLSLKRDEAEVEVFKKEKKQLISKMSALEQTIAQRESKINCLEKEKSDLEHEKDTILENSVQEITERDANITIIQAEKNDLEMKLNALTHVESENRDMKHEKYKIHQELEELQYSMKNLSEVKKENEDLKKMLKTHRQHEREFEAATQEKEAMLNHLGNEVKDLERKILHMENSHDQEMKSQKEMMNVQKTAAATEKSRYLRELQELKDQLLRANASSDRDNALKDKVFNDAKAEVMSLNKKIEHKSRKVKSLEESLQQMESQMFELDSERKNLDEQVQHWKTVANEYNEKAREEKKNMPSKSIRSDTLVTELYCENAELMKQVANAETNQAKAEKQVRQLTDQKRALQRVISKLCNSYGITNLS